MAGKHRKGPPVDEPRPAPPTTLVAPAPGWGPPVQPAAPTVTAPTVTAPTVTAPTVILPTATLPTVTVPESRPEPAGSAPAVSLVPGGRPSARRAEREQRRARGRRSRLVVGAVAAVVVLALVAAGVAVLRGSGAAPEETAATPSRTQSTLLMQVLDGQRQTVDGVLLAHDSQGQGTGYGALVPSSLVVQVPGSGSTTFGASSTSGGPTSSSAAVSDALGVLVDGSWQVDTTGLAALVDAVGGVDATVDRDVVVANVVVVPAGAAHLDGRSAAAFATFLAGGEAEQARLARFDTVLQAVLAKLPSDQAALGAVLSGLGTHATSTLPVSRLSQLLLGLRGDATGDRYTSDVLPVHVLDTGTGTPQMLLDGTAASALVATNYAGSLPRTPAGGKVRVLVQNGVGTPGLVEKARAKLVAAGLTYVGGGNASSFGHPTSYVLIEDATQQSLLQGSQVARALGLPAADVQITPQGQTVADVVVVLGKDFTP